MKRTPSLLVGRERRSAKQNVQDALFAFHTLCTGQEVVFAALGVDVLNSAFEGYNACIFAYGQTGKYTASFGALRPP